MMVGENINFVSYKFHEKSSKLWNPDSVIVLHFMTNLLKNILLHSNICRPLEL